MNRLCKIGTNEDPVAPRRGSSLQIGFRFVLPSLPGSPPQLSTAVPPTLKWDRQTLTAAGEGNRGHPLRSLPPPRPPPSP
jgi:hypothetical protein